MHVKEGEMKVQVIFILVANSYGKINISIRFQKVNYVLSSSQATKHQNHKLNIIPVSFSFAWLIFSNNEQKFPNIILVFMVFWVSVITEHSPTCP